ncbi:S8 family serine peptidase [Streptomyces sp. NPDC051569]|uniref:S8 family serine peptidase n=1 Tax=Streptomyces sp. NPDC051569 TaxID=3365661 RepID=UPI0037875F61
MVLTRTLRILGSAAAAGALLLTTPPTATADQVRNDQWPLQAFDADKIWQLATGKGITVAVIDDGVDAHHPDLAGNILPGKDFIDGGSTEPDGTDHHGTSMAGIIAGHGHGPNGSEGVKGLAPGAKILAIRDSGLTSSPFTESVRYAVDHGASIISISQAANPPTKQGAEAIAYALKKDVLVVASTGNDGTGGDLPIYPASYPGAVAVGAVGSSGEIWGKSNFGPKTMLTAPGVDIVAAGGVSSDYNEGDGTSNSAAYVSAAAALLREKFPDLTAGQIVNRLTKTAGLPSSAKGIKLPDEKYGYGYIQPLAALKNNIPPGPANGPLIMPAPTNASEPAAPGAQAADDSESSGGLTTSAVQGLATAGVVFLLVVGGVTLLVVRSGKRKRRAAEQRNQQSVYGSYSPHQPHQPHQPPYPPQPPQPNSGSGPYQQQSPPSGPPNQPPTGYNPYQQ